MATHAKWAVLAAVVALALYVIAVAAANRPNAPLSIKSLGALTASPPSTQTLDVMIWNIGYGGLGAESDFVADGGENLRPPNRRVVDKNIDGVVRTLEAPLADVILVQEAARPSFMTHGADPLGALVDRLEGRDNAFSADFALRLLPPPLNPRHGLFSSVTLPGATRSTEPLPNVSGASPFSGDRHYHLHVIKATHGGVDWTFVNVHLSAFDEDARLRAEQLNAVFEFAAAEYDAGAHVVLGGDWNLEFARPGRPSTTADEHLFWIHAFPISVLPAGWSIAVDRETPSVRTNERPYAPGENFTTVIDGFVVSPNVEAISVNTQDLDFQYTDHHPIRWRFRARMSFAQP